MVIAKYHRINRCLVSLSVFFLPVFFLVNDLFSAPSPPRESVPVTKIGRTNYVSLDDLARIFHATTTWHWLEKKIVAEFNGKETVLLVDSPIALVENFPVNLCQPTILVKGRVFVSPLFATSVVAKLTGQRLEWSPELGCYLVEGREPNVVGLKTNVEPGATDLILMLTEPLKCVSSRLPNRTIIFRVEQAMVDVGVPDHLSAVGLLESVDLKQSPDQLQVVVKTGEEVAQFSSKLLSDPHRLVLSFKATAYDSTLRRAIVQSLTGIKEGRDKFDVVVIDPGHGGKDPGAIGRSYRTKEKVITLKIAKILARMLREKLGLKVILTRKDDSFVPLRRRAEIANQNKADLFVSIHCNSNRSRRVRGFEVYFLGHAKTDHARAVAQMENSSIRFEANGGDKKTLEDLGFILWDLAQNAYLEESSYLAELVTYAMGEKLNIPNRGANQNIFYVLVGAFMPSILVETAFLSNRQEERFLRSRSGQQKIAEALFDGILRYKQHFEKRLGYSGRKEKKTE